MRAHAVGERLDQRGALAAAGALQRRTGDREAGEHVVAVDADAGEAEALGALVERDAGLPLGRLGDRPLVVLAEEDDRRVVDRGEGEGLGDVALAGGAVAEVGDDRRVRAVLGDAHRVAGGVQRLRADDDRVEVEVVAVRVPAAVVHAAEHAEQVRRVDAPAPGDAVLAVGREDVVVVAQGPAGADLGGLLAEQRGPQAQLALALQGGGLGVEAAGQHHVPVQAAQLFGGQVDGVLRVLDPLALGRQQLYELGLGTLWRLRGARRPLARCVAVCARQCSPRSRACSSVGPAPGVCREASAARLVRRGARGGCGMAGNRRDRCPGERPATGTLPSTSA